MKFKVDLNLQWDDIKKYLIMSLPYICTGLCMTVIGKAWRLSPGSNSSEKVTSFIRYLPLMLQRPLPSLHILDLLFGICSGAILRIAVYLKSKDAKKYRHNVEYGSARWGAYYQL